MARLRGRARSDVCWPDLPSAHRASAHLLHCMACINGAGLRIVALWSAVAHAGGMSSLTAGPLMAVTTAFRRRAPLRCDLRSVLADSQLLVPGTCRMPAGWIAGPPVTSSRQTG